MRKVSVSFYVPELSDLRIRNPLRNIIGRRGDGTPREIPENGIEVVKTIRLPYRLPLHQPAADPDEEIRAAVTEWRQQAGTRVPTAVVFPNESLLLKVFPLPSVLANQVESVVRYEAKQQIPFALESVEYRWSVDTAEIEKGYFMNGVVSLYALRRDYLQKQFSSFDSKELRGWIDCLTSRVHTMREFVAMQQTTHNGTDEAHHLILDMHGCSSDIYAVKGGRICWCRSIPIGGNHFTSELCRDLKLSFAEAERMKLSVASAENQKQVLDVMLRGYDDLLVELKRSLAFYKVVIGAKSQMTSFSLLGNPSKLPGLATYMANGVGLPISDLSIPGIAFSDPEEETRFKSDLGNYRDPFFAAVNRLGYGKFRENFLPGGKPFGLGKESAWGVSVGNDGFTAVKVRRVGK